MGDQAPIPIESPVTQEPDSTEAGGGAPGRTSSARVVHEPSRWPRLAAIIGLVGLVAGGLVWTVRDGDVAPAADEENESARDASVPPDTQTATRSEFATAMLRWGGVASFAYRGSVHAAATRPFGAGTSTAGDLTVEGAVLPWHGLAPPATRQVTVDGRGRAEETLTSGSTVWTRVAASADSLDGAPWQVRASTSADPTIRLDMQMVAWLLRAAGDPRGEAPDTASRRMIRATLPTRAESGGDVPPLAGADVLLTLDGAGDIAHIVVTWPAHDPQLVLDVEISGHDDPQDIAPPDIGPAALRRTVPLADAEAAGVRPLDVGLVPAGWRLTGAWLAPETTEPGDCPVFNLWYRDPGAVSEDYLWLSVTSERCEGSVSEFTGTRHHLAVGAFEGSFARSGSSITGALFDGTTALGFGTDLPLGTVAMVLESLRPFDPAGNPDPIPVAPH